MAIPYTTNGEVKLNKGTATFSYTVQTKAPTKLMQVVCTTSEPDIVSAVTQLNPVIPMTITKVYTGSISKDSGTKRWFNYYYVTADKSYVGQKVSVKITEKFAGSVTNTNTDTLTLELTKDGKGAIGSTYYYHKFQSDDVLEKHELIFDIITGSWPAGSTLTYATGRHKQLSTSNWTASISDGPLVTMVKFKLNAPNVPDGYELGVYAKMKIHPLEVDGNVNSGFKSYSTQGGQSASSKIIIVNGTATVYVDRSFYRDYLIRMNKGLPKIRYPLANFWAFHVFPVNTKGVDIPTVRWPDRPSELSITEADYKNA